MLKMLTKLLKKMTSVDDLIVFEYILLYEINVVKRYLCKRFEEKENESSSIL